jgi:hypothetical protein
MVKGLALMLHATCVVWPSIGSTIGGISNQKLGATGKSKWI